MQSKFNIEDPDAVDYTLSITLPLWAWKELQQTCAELPRYPFIPLTEAIEDMVNHAGTVGQGTMQVTEPPKGRTDAQRLLS